MKIRKFVKRAADDRGWIKINRVGMKKGRLPELRMHFRLLLYVIALFLGVLSVVESIHGYFFYALDIVIYVLAACSLVAAVAYLLQGFIQIIKKTVGPVIESNAFANRVYSDYRYRTVLFTLISFLISIFYAVSNGILGILESSAWLGTLSAYYIFLSIMRFGTVWYERKLSKMEHDRNAKIQELKVYRNTGIMLALITVALSGAVNLLLNQEGGKSYHGYMIFVVALYTFYKIIVSVTNIIKARKMKSLLLMTIRNIGHADALVSVLSLQTAMFASFGDQSDIDSQMMNGITGGCVCVLILTIGIHMIYTSGRERRVMNSICEKDSDSN